MTEKSNGAKAEEPQGGAKVGQILQQARMAAHIEVNKICADLRISPHALEAIEQGNYHLLPGDPYIRALLGSMSRYLGLDPAGVVKEYNKEIGAASPEPAAVPYTDKAHTYSTAHKQIFVAIVGVLFLVLFLLIGRLNRGESVPTPPPVAGPAPTESLAAPGDSTPESKALAPDSAAADSARDSSLAKPVPGTPAPSGAPAGAATAPPANTATPSATTPAPGAQAAAAAAAQDTAGLVVAVIKPLVDSVGVRVVRSGKEDYATLLRLGKQMQVSHPDTITVYTSQRNTVEVTVGGKSVTPTRKRFKIYGQTVKVY
jgi:cytoskeletal protein RodZ